MSRSPACCLREYTGDPPIPSPQSIQLMHWKKVSIYNFVGNISCESFNLKGTVKNYWKYNLPPSFHFLVGQHECQDSWQQRWKLDWFILSKQKRCCWWRDHPSLVDLPTQVICTAGQSANPTSQNIIFFFCKIMTIFSFISALYLAPPDDPLMTVIVMTK